MSITFSVPCGQASIGKIFPVWSRFLDDIRACGLLLLHLGYRSPQWLGDDFFSGMGAIHSELERAGNDPSRAFGEEAMRLVRTGEFVLVAGQSDTLDFIVGDCGPFVSRDTELGSGQRKAAKKRSELVSGRGAGLDGTVLRRGAGRCGKRGRCDRERGVAAKLGVVGRLGGSFQRTLCEAQLHDRGGFGDIGKRSVAIGMAVGWVSCSGVSGSDC